MGGGHFPQTGWAWCHIGGLCPWAAISLGVGVGGVPAPKTRLPLAGQGGSGRKAVQGNAPSWTGRTGLGWQDPPIEKRLGAQPGFPSQNLWHLGGGGYHPRGGAPTALLEGDGRDSDGLDALCYPKVVPILPLSSLICKVGIIQSPQAFCGPGMWKHSIHHNCH